MAKTLAPLEGVIRPALVAELESFRAPGQRVSTYYLDLNPRRWGSVEAVRIALKNALADAKDRLDRLEDRPAVRHALRRDWETVSALAPTVVGEAHTVALACFVASDSGYGRAVRLPWPLRNQSFFENHFVLWPLRRVMDQADRYAVLLTDKEHARLFLFFLEQAEEVAGVLDVVPGRVSFPDPLGESHYMHKHVEHFHHHFARAAEAALRQFQREPFEHLIVGGRWETLPQFEGHLHRYLRDRIVARWEIDVHAPTREVQGRVREEEQRFLERQARAAWETIQDQRQQRGAVGSGEVFSALWGRRVQTLLVEPDVVRPGFRCPQCSRLQTGGGPCVECGGTPVPVPDVLEEAVRDAVEQSAQVRYWKDPALHAVESVAAVRRY